MTDIDRNEPKALKDSALEDVAGGFANEEHEYYARDYKHCGIQLIKNANSPDQFIYKGRVITEAEANAIVDSLSKRNIKI